MNNVSAVLGRFLLSAIFFVSAYRKFEDPAAVATSIAEATAKAPWVPEAVALGVRDAAPLLAWAAITFEVLGAFCLVTGFKKELGAALLLIFLVPTTFLFHSPGDPAQQMQFLKNVAIMGGLLLVVASGPQGRDRAL
ncbi:MAG: DoxX family protein [Candidatus Eisenbacteria bacterium]